MSDHVRATIADFIVENFLFGDGSRLPEDQVSLLESGIIDSTGILELIEFIEGTFGIRVNDSETIPDNLGSIASLTAYVDLKIRAA
jgi:acyl carrier protein